MKGKKVKHIVSVLVVIILIAANIACFSFENIITMYFAKANVADEGTIAEVTKNSEEMVKDLAAEGVVLLDNKNNVLPLDVTENSKVNIFGWNSVSLLYGGTGSGGGDASKNITLQEGLKQAGIEVNENLTEQYQALGYERLISGPLNGFQPDFNLYEGDANFYTEELLADAKTFSDTAIVVISRTGGEGSDLATDMAEWDGDAGRHMLELSSKEEVMLDVVTKNFEHVIVLINASNAMELGFVEQEGIDAALWIGGPGKTGFASVAKILTGEINPSGALIDTYAYDATSSPAFANAGDFKYGNTAFEVKHWVTGEMYTEYEHYLNYQEGIYTGYRYYETRYVDNETLECDETAYRQAVQYPFGYGLSYSEFTQEMSNFKADETKIEVEVKVTNTGSVAGKDIVQIYYTAPYTVGGIEKSHVVLGAFDKTETLEPGKSETIKLEIPVEEMASYDYKNAKAYVLEAGNYEIKLMDNAHDLIASQTYEVPETIVYDENNKRSTDEVVATNQFDDAIGTITYVSRADWEGTLPKDVKREQDASEELIAKIRDLSFEVNEEDPDIVMKDNGLALSDVVGLDYDDPKWDLLLEQLSVDDMKNLIGFGGYATLAVKSIEKPATVDIDGPAGINALVNEKAFNGVNYTSEVIMASTWNTDLVYRMGQVYGQEASAWGVSGLYAPSMNQHRSPFSGRNFEYYSEDGFLSGKMAAAEVKGIAESGVYCYIKHFALNDQETNRASVCTWSNEQAIREIYLKPFEMAVKEGGSTAVMSSFNRIGTTWAGASSALLQNVLRDEWGFRGMVITDYDGEDYMNPDMAIRAGNDLMLSTMGDMPQDTSNTGKQAMRNASHNILYTVANSNIMGVDSTNQIPTWKIILGVADVVIIGLLVLWYVVGGKKKKEEIAEEVKQDAAE